MVFFYYIQQNLLHTYYVLMCHNRNTKGTYTIRKHQLAPFFQLDLLLHVK